MDRTAVFIDRAARARRLVFVIAAVALLATACQATAEVTMTNEGNATTSVDAPSIDSSSSTETPGTDTTAPAEGSESSSTASGEALFELRGELPLSTAEVNELIEFIQDDSGRDFLHPPVIVAQTSDEFFAGLSESVSDFEDDAQITVRSLQSLGLTTQGVNDVSSAFVDLLLSPDGILGYYDPEPDELYVPADTEGDDDFRSLLVHELTHALDGQYVDLNVLDVLVDEAEISGDFEPVVALQAVAEGRASSVQNRWMRENGVPLPTSDDLSALERVPPALVLSLSIPYAFGEQYVESNGGAAGTWELLETPPPSSEDFMVFGGIAPGQTIVDVAPPPADGPVLDEVVFGAADIFVWLLGEQLEPDPALIFPTFTAIDGWAGGKAVLWGDDNESCTRIAIATDSQSDFGEMRDAIDTWVQAGPNRSVESNGDLIIVTGCAAFVP